jgi:hypothetical protein
LLLVDGVYLSLTGRSECWEWQIRVEPVCLTSAKKAWKAECCGRLQRKPPLKGLKGGAMASPFRRAGPNKIGECGGAMNPIARAAGWSKLFARGD